MVQYFAPSAETEFENPTPKDTRAYSPTKRAPGILIVDADIGVRRVLGVGLKHYGFTVWLAADIAEALEHCRIDGPSIDTALVDVLVAGGDGPGVMADLRRARPHLRTCFMASSSGPYGVQELLDSGALAVFKKPFSLRGVAVQLVELAGVRSAAR